jgi:hypothetical protein
MYELLPDWFYWLARAVFLASRGICSSLLHARLGSNYAVTGISTYQDVPYAVKVAPNGHEQSSWLWLVVVIIRLPHTVLRVRDSVYDCAPNGHEQSSWLVICFVLDYCGRRVCTLLVYPVCSAL